MRKNIIHIIFILKFLYACDGQSEQKDHTNQLTIIADEITTCNIQKYSEIYDSVRFIALETSKNCLIGGINNLIYFKNKFFVHDKHIAKSVFIFDKNGKFECQIGKIGKAPGEYIEPTFTCINKFSNEFLIYDRYTNQILIYNLNGVFLRSILLHNRIEALSAVGSDRYALYFNYFANESIKDLPKHNLHVINEKGKVLYKAFNRVHSKKPNATCFNYFYTYDSLTLFSQSLDNYIYEIKNEDVGVKYNIDFGNKTLTNDFLNSIIMETENRIEIHEKIKDSDKAIISGFFETENNIVLKVSFQKKLYNIFYSKLSGKVKYSNMYINDMYGLIPGSHNIYGSFSDNIILSYIMPSGTYLDYYKKLLKNSLVDPNYIKRDFVRNIKNTDLSYCSRLMNTIIENTEFKTSVDEFEFIKSIIPNSNPIIILNSLKEF